MAVSSPLSSRQTVAALLTLTAVTGLVDAVSYLRLGRVFVANMTGNVVFLGFSVDPRSGLSAAASIIAIAGFILGALAGGPGPKPHRRLGSVAAMLAGALAGAGILQWSPTAVIAIAAALVAAVSGAFMGVISGLAHTSRAAPSLGALRRERTPP
jgi:uncharacterized membrane protein YoaK (UPF0700 family)